MPGEGPSPQFLASLNAALAYFKRLEAAGDIAQMDRERKNINLAIELGLSRPETRIAAIEALLGAFQLLYARGYWQEGKEIFEKALADCPDDRIDLQIELLGRYGELQRIDGHLSAAVATHKSELALAEKLNNPLLTGRAHAHLAHTYREKHLVGLAQQYGLAAISELEKAGKEGQSDIADVLNALGRIARQQGDLSEALDYLQQVVVIRRQLNNEISLAEGLHDLARVFQDLQRYEEALACYQEAEQILDGTEHVLKRIRLQLDMGVLYFNQHDYILAESMFRAVDMDYLRQNGHLIDEARTLTNIGNAVLYQERYAEAALLLSRAVTIRRKLEDRLKLANVVGSLGEALAGLGQYAQAREYLQEGLTLLSSFANLPYGQRLIDLFTNELNKIDQK